MTAPAQVVVTGVSGSGKTTVGGELARRLGVQYGDADDFHPPANIVKMRAGEPLSEADREPWLAAIGAWLGDRTRVGAVASCSALCRAHRDRLRAAATAVVFVQLRVPEAVLRQRMRDRGGHFMPVSLLDSQLATLEPLEPDECGVTIDGELPVDTAVTTVHGWLVPIPR
ncbi:MAG: gluconokinase [Nocardioidaceae bacterium]|nr:gluconokinase [Nocardioidaceae bacterium]